MASVNKVILIGNLGRDPESRHAPSGDMICNLNIATTETWRDRNTGENREATEWHRVVFFGRTAEVAAQYLRAISSSSASMATCAKSAMRRLRHSTKSGT